jgi:hypothetical protein
LSRGVHIGSYIGAREQLEGGVVIALMSAHECAKKSALLHVAVHIHVIWVINHDLDYDNFIRASFFKGIKSWDQIVTMFKVALLLAAVEYPKWLPEYHVRIDQAFTDKLLNVMAGSSVKKLPTSLKRTLSKISVSSFGSPFSDVSARHLSSHGTL